VPMRIAVGTSSLMVGATALMGLAGHAAQGHFNPHWALPMACIAVIGGIIGSKYALLDSHQFTSGGVFVNPRITWAILFVSD